MTGRGMGLCAGYANPGYVSGRGFGMGAGRGFRARRFRPFGGRGFGYNAWVDTPYGPMMQGPVKMSAEDEKAFLKDQAQMIEDELKSIKQRLTELK
jgi:hypothetical protein